VQQNKECNHSFSCQIHGNLTPFAFTYHSMNQTLLDNLPCTSTIVVVELSIKGYARISLLKSNEICRRRAICVVCTICKALSCFGLRLRHYLLRSSPEHYSKRRILIYPSSWSIVLFPLVVPVHASREQQAASTSLRPKQIPTS
jgi:hypothetical protein